MDLKVKEWFEKIKSIDGAVILASLKAIDRKTWVQISAEAIAVFLFIVFAFYPGWIKRPALEKKVAEVEVQNMRLRALIPKKPELEKQKQEIVSLIEDFQKRLFLEKETPFLLGKVSKIAQDAQVELVASRPMDEVEAFPEPYSQKYQKNVYQITVEGSYHRIAEFVSQLESHDHYFQIQALSINPQARAVGKLIADVKLMAVSHRAEVINAKK